MENGDSKKMSIGDIQSITLSARGPARTEIVKYL